MHSVIEHADFGFRTEKYYQILEMLKIDIAIAIHIHYAALHHETLVVKTGELAA